MEACSVVQEWFFYINMIACALIAVRIIFYTTSRQSHYKPLVALLAYVICISSASVTIKGLFGIYRDHSIEETLLNVIFCIVIFNMQGNLSTLIDAIKGRRG